MASALISTNQATIVHETAAGCVSISGALELPGIAQQSFTSCTCVCYRKKRELWGIEGLLGCQAAWWGEEEGEVGGQRATR